MQWVYCKTEKEWRTWLKKNHDRRRTIWLVFRKDGIRGQTLDYESALRQALCFGWIDSIIKKLDETRYVRKFTRRNEMSKWSPLNKERVRELTRQGLMEKAGLAVVGAAKRNGSWDKPDRPVVPKELPECLLKALERNEKAKNHFNRMAPGYRRRYIMWISAAKQEATKRKRTKESIELLENGNKLGLR
jgi:uncharacterized protein YdeI (YjbR/CyaY-like superfamily)